MPYTGEMEPTTVATPARRVTGDHLFDLMYAHADRVWIRYSKSRHYSPAYYALGNAYQCALHYMSKDVNKRILKRSL